MKKERKKLTMESNKKIMLNVFSGLLLFLIACGNNSNNQNEITINQVSDTYKNNQDSIIGRSVNFYTQNKNCSQIAKNYYAGKFNPSDNDSTTELLNLSLTSDTLLRPFYFWCLDNVIREADGALMEYVGIPARKYIEKYPTEFFKYISSKQFFENKNNWVTAINYSGYYDYESTDNKKEALRNFVTATTKSCFKCTVQQKTEIKSFAKECFSE
ncbi:hypothetical protein [Ferruginibacter sp.]|nr:hypothetical protein [Ferruginibacter sp.]